MTTRNGNVAMITGAAGALGQSTAETFLKAGYRLVLIDREIERLQQKWNGRDGVLCLQCDLTDTESIDTAVVTAPGSGKHRLRSPRQLCAAGSHRYACQQARHA
ncbi:SDR family NAD(P)-dependent oxidoreductase [Prosthecochloris sp. ZM_2]|uniref:SDR family NAD(P)-dependent oxidoreductase n=1 Tax=Prosthecochloris sp. ZM_2 TaxID=2045206 RepID=UPI000F099CF2|nr:SDR family NAD(P)-dependent oxidoreductase [Prosthecochloris sp. ZM_2]